MPHGQVQHAMGDLLRHTPVGLAGKDPIEIGAILGCQAVVGPKAERIDHEERHDRSRELLEVDLAKEPGDANGAYDLRSMDEALDPEGGPVLATARDHDRRVERHVGVVADLDVTASS